MSKPQTQLNLEPTWLDRTIGVFSPGRMSQRMYHRAQSELLQESMRQYNAGTYSRRTANWKATGASANKETEMSLHTLRWRNRELVRNNPFARRAVKGLKTNVVGPGIRPRPIPVKGQSASKQFKEAWVEWAESTDCDFDGQMNMYGLQGLMMETVAQSGEVLVRRRFNAQKEVSLQLQVLEPDFLDSSKNTPVTSRGGYIIQGVEFDTKGRRSGYWLYDVHPGEGAINNSQFVPEAEVLHIYSKERPGQVRGVPMLSTAAMTLRDFDDYEQAQLVRQKLAACFAIFIQDTDRDQTTPSSVGMGPKLEKLEPGIVEYLPAGKTMTFANPPTVNGYSEYAIAILRKAAAGIGVSYEVLTGDYSNVNFSSGRMGWIEMHRIITDLQTMMMIPMGLDPIGKWFVDSAKIAGKIKSSSIIRLTWTPPRREMIDPVKETKAITDMLRAGLISYQRAIAETGQDPDVVLEEIVESFKKMDAAELMLTCNPKWDATRTNGAEPEEVDENGEPVAAPAKPAPAKVKKVKTKKTP